MSDEQQTSINHLNHNLARKEDETFEQYKIRRKMHNIVMRQYFNGKLVHESIKMVKNKVYDAKDNTVKDKIEYVSQTYVKPKENNSVSH